MKASEMNYLIAVKNLIRFVIANLSIFQIESPFIIF